MNAIFADAGYWIALLHPRDEHHRKAQELSRSFSGKSIVTTEMVLAEFLNAMAGEGAALRRAAVRFVAEMRTNLNVEIVPQTSRQFSDAFALYRSRMDKGWGLTDCASFIVMREHKIRETMAHDQDFQQAGFRALLRGD
jgi:predicted nucleic acid-binding protein